jgi:hypothetical protein
MLQDQERAVLQSSDPAAFASKLNLEGPPEVIDINNTGFLCPGKEEAYGFYAGAGGKQLSHQFCAKIAESIEKIPGFLEVLACAHLGQKL